MRAMPVTINNRPHLIRVLGDIALIFTWVNGERALALAPALRKGASWFVVPESVAWRYADDPQFLARRAAAASQVLDMPGQAARIGYLIHDHLTDLRRMPPEPVPVRGAALGEVVVRANGQPVGGHEVRPDAPGGLTFGA
jgi:hypothetical protein